MFRRLFVACFIYTKSINHAVTCEFLCASERRYYYVCSPERRAHSFEIQPITRKYLGRDHQYDCAVVPPLFWDHHQGVMRRPESCFYFLRQFRPKVFEDKKTTRN